MASSRPVPTSKPVASLCPNCGNKSLGEYCAHCGQRAPNAKTDYSLWEQAKSFVVSELINYDGRIFATVRALLLKPGLLTREYFDGRRDHYVGPLRIFVLANVALWFLSPYVGIRGFSLEVAKRYAMFRDTWLSLLERRADLAGVSVEQMGARVEAAGAAENQVAVLCLSPMLAFGIWVVLSGRGYRYMQHLIFAAHFFCVHITILILTWGLVMIPLRKYGLAHPEIPWAASFSAAWAKSNLLQHMSVAPALFPYVFASVRRAYALTTKETTWRAILITLWACLVTRSFFDVAFALVLIFA